MSSQFHKVKNVVVISKYLKKLQNGDNRTKNVLNLPAFLLSLINICNKSLDLFQSDWLHSRESFYRYH